MTPKDIRRLMSKIGVLTKSGCWEWQGTLFSSGYGAFSINGINRKAHRIVYEHFVGGLDPALTIDHLCRNRKCVNPSHMEQVSQGENTLRGNGVSGVNARKTECIRGHPFAGDNLAFAVDGSRVCRSCKRETASRIYHEKRHTPQQSSQKKEVARTIAVIWAVFAAWIAQLPPASLSTMAGG